MKNKLSNLNDYMFMQIERLSDESITPEELEKEIARGKAINDIAKTVVDNARLVLAAVKARDDGLITVVPEVIGIEK